MIIIYHGNRYDFILLMNTKSGPFQGFVHSIFSLQSWHRRNIIIKVNSIELNYIS